MKFSKLLQIHAEYALESLPRFFTRLAPSAPLLDEAFRLSFRLRHPVYDCLFLALGLREDARVLTADRMFHAAAGKSDFADSVILLEDIA